MSERAHHVPGLEPVLTTSELAAHLDVPVQVSPHTFRRTSGTVIARATDAKTAAEVGNTEEIAQRHYIEPEEPIPHTAPAIHLKALAPREDQNVA